MHHMQGGAGTLCSLFSEVLDFSIKHVLINNSVIISQGDGVSDTL